MFTRPVISAPSLLGTSSLPIIHFLQDVLWELWCFDRYIVYHTLSRCEGSTWFTLLVRVQQPWNTAMPILPELRKKMRDVILSLVQTFDEFVATPPKIAQFIVDSSGTHWGGYFSPGGGRKFMSFKGGLTCVQVSGSVSKPPGIAQSDT
eukprot:GHVR01029300.1.p1 GENE.GHVR01029300.1~~GHVR01029300.1.p1  ORF type:complete len:149 (-),score=6.92 GHVR01029300.1:1421-1867(-)